LAALCAEAQGYVLKTDAGNELLAAVAAVLGGNNIVSSGIRRLDCGENEQM
jgi:DNA-binding NarL/FixJ family response regulator